MELSLTQYILRQKSGGYHYMYKMGGWEYIDSTDNPWMAMKFSSIESAKDYCKSQGHLRWLDYDIIEIRSTLIEEPVGKFKAMSQKEQDAYDEEYDY